MPPASLEQILTEVRHLGSRLDLRDDLSDLVRQTLSCVEGLRVEVQAVSKRFDILEHRVLALERKVGV